LIPAIDNIPPGGKPPIISTVKFEDNSFDILRLDTIHEYINGNKWFKLKNAIAYCWQHKLKGIISYGGVYSNHLHALSYAANALNLESIGIINGTHSHLLNTPTMKDCAHAGMQLYLGGFNAYKNIITINTVIDKHISDYYVMPMGGGDALAIKGAGDICSFIADSYTDIWITAGSGTTAIGLLERLQKHQHLHIINPVKNNNELDILLKSTTCNNYTVYNYNITGKFGKINNEVISLMHTYNNQFNITLDGIYTIHTMHYLVMHKTLLSNKNYLMIHTGGLQGNRSVF
jgi:1-aminocyclopropane-1-carboxylate deaminase